MKFLLVQITTKVKVLCCMCVKFDSSSLSYSYYFCWIWSKHLASISCFVHPNLLVMYRVVFFLCRKIHKNKERTKLCNSPNAKQLNFQNFPIYLASFSLDIMLVCCNAEIYTLRNSIKIGLTYVPTKKGKKCSLDDNNRSVFRRWVSGVAIIFSALRFLRR